MSECECECGCAGIYKFEYTHFTISSAAIKAAASKISKYILMFRRVTFDVDAINLIVVFYFLLWILFPKLTGRGAHQQPHGADTRAGEQISGPRKRIKYNHQSNLPTTLICRARSHIHSRAISKKPICVQPLIIKISFWKFPYNTNYIIWVFYL